MDEPSGRMPALGPEEAREAAKAAGLPGYFAPLNLFRVLLLDPPLAKAFSDLVVYLFRESELDERLRELAIMRVAWVTGSCYEWSQHWKLATGLGIDERDLLGVRDWRADPRYGSADRAVLAATDEVLDSGVVGEDALEQCRRELGKEKLVIDLVVSIATWRMVSEILRSLDIRLEQGMSHWPPDGVSPG
jgi:alkylhydroperoxidase family enzyme